MTRWIVVAALVAACGKGDGKGKAGGSMDEFQDAKVKTAKVQIGKFAFEAYGQWISTHPEAQPPCPASISDLTPFMMSDDVHDPWGTPYTLECVPSQQGKGYDLRVKSAGPDGKMGTDDDLDSGHLN
jgi:hypothetical protein